MTAPDELLVIQPKNRVVGVQKLRVEDDLDAVLTPVEELAPPNLVQDGVVRVVGHVVSRDGRERVTTKGEDATLEEDLVFRREKLGGVGDFSTVFSGVAGGALEEALSDAVLDLGDGVAELLSDGLTLERLNGVRVSRGGGDDERDDGLLRSRDLEAVVEAGEGLDEHVETFVAVLVTSSGEEVERVVEVEVVVLFRESDRIVSSASLRELQREERTP
jgi:hypothetical protein